MKYWKMAYITRTFKRALENENVSVELLSNRLGKIERKIRNRIDVVLRQLSMLQREQVELESMHSQK
ncbi:hypothetical protein NEMIN01_2370 [Nematocida minor]|uniref:uncharacterized protein n=1 Tax=Nematocida minor TaxID=1912983 RepID=UPI00221FB271|nr:uncharacterized protein NEMIN01_2370 [Nematocida minor]KAI5193026.1 hypothetical protein NEMIN01_2370 [Nematocida minor]